MPKGYRKDGTPIIQKGQSIRSQAMVKAGQEQLVENGKILVAERNAGKPKKASTKLVVLQAFDQMLSGASSLQSDADTQTFLQSYLENFQESALKGTWASKLMFEAIDGKNMLANIEKILSKAKREDEDFQRYRIFLKAHDVQQKIMLSKAKKKFLMAGRRAGKTEGNALIVTDKMMTKPNSRCVFIALTVTKAHELYFNKMVDLLNDLGAEIIVQSSTAELIKISNGSEVYFKGNNTKDEREKMRGDLWDVVVIDEVQSHKALPYLIEDIISPTLLDRQGDLILSGTGPRVRGTYWEHLWTTDKGAFRANWNLTENPFIPDHATVLEKIKEEKGLTDASPLFIREYLGQISYDDDALLLRMSEKNFYEEELLSSWANSQPVTDLHLTAGLDYGWTDCDAFVIVLYSDSKPEKWVMFEHKANRTGVQELADKIKFGMNHVLTHPALARMTDRDCPIYADTSEGRVTFELNQLYGLPVFDAYKQNKDFAYEQLQDDVRKGTLLVRKGGIIEDEAMKTVFVRNEKDELTREIDHETFHPDALDALLYSMRKLWLYSSVHSASFKENEADPANQEWEMKKAHLPEWMK